MADQLPEKKPQISEDTIRQLLTVQQQELALRLKEVERDSSEIEYNRGIATQSIEAQERDRKHEREETTKRQKDRHRFLFWGAVMALAFVGGCLYLGKDAIVLDLLKVLLGFLGGYGVHAAVNASEREKRGNGSEED